MTYKSIFLFLFSFSIAVFLSCEKSVIEYSDKGTVPKDLSSTSLKDDIQPIFNTSCISCHGGAVSPNLSDGVTFSSLNNSKYINKTTPETSLIYTKLTTIGGSHDGKVTSTNASKILKWIKEGALNN